MIQAPLLQVKQFKGQQYPEVKAYNEVQIEQLDADAQFTQPNGQAEHNPDDG